MKATIPPIKESRDYPMDSYNTKDKTSEDYSELWHPLTKEKVLQDLAISRRQIEEGECKSALNAIEEVRIKYGL